ncbi:MAG: DUF5360 family protein [Pseudomonadota bacterium]
MKRDSTTIRVLLTATEVGMLLYWVFAAVVALGMIHVAPAHMYPDHTNPTVVAWNWSFFPLDVLFAITGLISRFGSVSSNARRSLSTVSLSLMFCAGLMAISFWVIVQFFDPVWWGLNLWLMVLPFVVMVLRLRAMD